MGESAIPLARVWNTWDPDFPAEVRFPPLGLSVAPCAYAASRNAFTRFPSTDPGVRLGPRALDGSLVHLDLAHAGTEIALDYDKPDPWTLRGRWRAGKLGEWGLRFWMLLVLRLSPPTMDGRLLDWRYDAETGQMRASVGPLQIVVGGERPPLLATFHHSIEELGTELESKGYFCLDSRGAHGPIAVLRYNFEETPELRFTAVLAHSTELAQTRRAVALAAEPAASKLPSQEGAHAGGLDAVRDVIGWNSVWDRVNRRPYTGLSRAWSSAKFGGWGVWLDDLFFHALMAGTLDAGLARDNLRAALGNATPQGNLACLVTGRDAWVDRSQPPLGSLVVAMLHRRTGARDLLEEAYPVLLANHRWWRRYRDGNGDGLYEYGTSTVGSGLYLGTKLAAKNESFMDNSPVHDEAVLDPEARTLDSADVGLNSLIALDGGVLAGIARELGEQATADHLDAAADELKELIRDRLWDGERGVFANRLWSGKFVRALAPTSFFPLLAGAATGEQAEALRRLLGDPAKFGGPWLLPSVARDDPDFADNVYWRGRIWPPLHFLVYHGLKRYGLLGEASALAESGHRLFRMAWADRRSPENFNADTGVANDQPDTDLFYGWGALMPFLGVSERIDFTPWHGWEMSQAGGDGRLGPIVTPAGPAEIVVASGVMTLAIAGRPVIATSAERLRHIHIGDKTIRLAAHRPKAGDWVAFPGLASTEVTLATIGGRASLLRARADGALGLDLPASEHEVAVDLLLRRGTGAGR